MGLRVRGMSHFGQSPRAAPVKRSTYDGRPALPWLAIDRKGGLVEGEIAKQDIFVRRELA